MNTPTALPPDRLGSVEMTPTGPFTAGELASFELIYTAGFFGIDDTGSLKVVLRYATDMGAPQFDDPAGPNFVTVEASNGAVLQTRYDVKDNVRPWGKTLYVKVVRGFLREGDRIHVRFGDRRRGSPGIRMQTFAEPTFEFKTLIDAIATYRYVELPESPTVAIGAGPPAAWRAVLPTLRRVSEPFRLSLKAEDRWGNPCDTADETVRLSSSVRIDRLPTEVSFTSERPIVVLEGLRIEEPVDAAVVEVTDESGESLARSNPLRITADSAFTANWADFHGQTEETVGTNSAEDYFEFARDRAFLDIVGHQGNDFQITGEFWKRLQELTARFDEPGRFVAIPGYEWSGNTALGGDRNVFYRHEGRPIFRSSHALVDDLSDLESDRHTAAELLAALHDEDAIVVPHVGGRYSDIRLAHDPKLERSIEIHSAWGTFEWLLHDAFELGYRVGIVANSDGHKGRPGASYPGASLFGAYGGLTCLRLGALSRDEVFAALRQRRHYATTGARMHLDVKVSLPEPGHPVDAPTAAAAVTEASMGEILRTTSDHVALAVDVSGAAPVERIEFFNGPTTVETHRPFGGADLGRRLRVVWEGAEYRGRGRQTIWDGSAKLRDNRFERAWALNFFDPDRTLERPAPDELRWRSLTTGNFAGFDAWLSDPRSGSLTIETPLVRCDIPITDIGLGDLYFDAGGLGRGLRIFRLPDENLCRQVHAVTTVRLDPNRDNPLYVRVTLEDGHRAWSSPIYLVR